MIPLTEINSNPIYQPPADWLEEEGEEITLFHEPEQQEIKELLLIELKTRMKHRKTTYMFNKKDPYHPNCRPLKDTNESYNLVQYTIYKWSKKYNYYLHDSHNTVKEKGLCDSIYIATWKSMLDNDKDFDKLYFKCKFSDCDFTVKSLKKILKENRKIFNSNSTKKDLIRMYMKM